MRFLPKMYLFDFLVTLFCCWLQSVILILLTHAACSCIAPCFLPAHPSWATSQLKEVQLDLIWEGGKEGGETK